MNHREAMRLAELAYFSKLLEETKTIAEARQVSGLSKAGIYKALHRLGLCNFGADSGKTPTVGRSWHGLNR